MHLLNVIAVLFFSLLMTNVTLRYLSNMHVTAAESTWPFFAIGYSSNRISAIKFCLIIDKKSNSNVIVALINMEWFRPKVFVHITQPMWKWIETLNTHFPYLGTSQKFAMRNYLDRGYSTLRCNRHLEQFELHHWLGMKRLVLWRYSEISPRDVPRQNIHYFLHIQFLCRDSSLVSHKLQAANNTTELSVRSSSYNDKCGAYIFVMA